MERVVVDVNETRQTRAARQMYSVTVTRRVRQAPTKVTQPGGGQDSRQIRVQIYCNYIC